MTTTPYQNARSVLPPELLAEIQKHCSGLLWIPPTGQFFRDRRRLVQALKEQGVPTREIARLAGISHRRVNQILAAKKEHCRKKK
jgi:hypothetical protein